MIKSDAFHLHLASLAKDQQTFKPLYIFSGDEPLLMMEAIDALRALARTSGFTEREVLVQDRYFDWAALISAGQTMSLFGDRRFIELRMPLVSRVERALNLLNSLQSKWLNLVIVWIRLFVLFCRA